jgi:hypothetical protein
MEADMKNHKRILAIGGIVLLLGIGYFIPTIVMKIKDWALMKEEKEVEIEAIQLDSQDVDMMEALSVFSEMLSNNLIVEVGEDFAISYTEVIQEESDSIPKKLYSDIQAFLTVLDVKEEVVLAELYAQNYVMMADKNDEKLYSIWLCKGIDKSGKEYSFWVDATLNKVMAFEVPFAIFGKGDEAFYSGLERAIEYYDFASYGSPIRSYMYDMDELRIKKYWKNEVEILNKDLQILLTLGVYRNGDRFLFNVDPGDVSITDKAESKN